jgi:hypothetical protein
MTDVEHLRLELTELRARVMNLERAPQVGQQRLTALIPLYSLLVSRIRFLEEKFLDPAEAASCAEFWTRALASIGIGDPLKLEDTK